MCRSGARSLEPTRSGHGKTWWISPFLGDDCVEAVLDHSSRLGVDTGKYGEYLLFLLIFWSKCCSITRADSVWTWANMVDISVSLGSFYTHVAGKNETWYADSRSRESLDDSHQVGETLTGWPSEQGSPGSSLRRADSPEIDADLFSGGLVGHDEHAGVVGAGGGHRATEDVAPDDLVQPHRVSCCPLRRFSTR